jgi:eukaryotic-like serine/threonine-protein kinase
VAFRCPYCSFSITVKTTPKPGKFTPKCPKCQGKIALTIPDDTASAWLAEAIPGEKPEKTISDHTVPVPPPSPSAPKASPPPPTPVSTNDATQIAGEATGVFAQQEPEDATGVYDTSASASEGATTDHTAVYTDGATRHDDGSDATMAHTSAAGEGDIPRKNAAGPKAKSKAKLPSSDNVEMPDSLGGYEVVKELGRGGMGAVYLARQVSLDRPVALKVMNTRWAADPIFLARFTREAFAAAQLVHHNVVQIYDIGEQESINYFSMEFVEGRSLGDTLKKEGKLTLEAAIGYILQAARGLKFAHDRGMVHRDIKPDNLMLNVHGIVKVADLGLVKTPTMSAADDALSKTEQDIGDSVKSMSVLKSMASDITMVNTAMGSPSYMSPEQCKNAANVDQRADIYSLGCTLYSLLNGKPPFTGTTVFDVMAKHATEPVKPLGDQPKFVNDLIAKSLAKNAAERHQTMDEFIADLERCLPGKGAGKPTEEQLSQLERAANSFQSSSAAKLKAKLMLPLFAGGILAALIAFFLKWQAGATLLALTLQTVVAYFVVDGILRKTYVFRKVREWVFGARITDWLSAGVGLLVFVAVLMINPILLTVWLGSAVGAVGLAFLFHMIFDKRAAAQRESSILETQNLLKRLRLNGMEEEAIRLFVAKNAGSGWEEYFETLFGYEAKIKARPDVQSLSGGEKLPVFAGWRDGLIARCDQVLQQRRDSKTIKHLQSVEVKKLKAEGVDAKSAFAQAEAAAEVLVEQAAEIKSSKKPVNINRMMVAANRNAPRPPRRKKPAMEILAAVVTGYKFRFLLAAGFILLGALWVKDAVPLDEISKSATQIVTAQGDAAAESTAKNSADTFAELFKRQKGSESSLIRKLPFVDSLCILVAGIVLLMSIFINRVPGVFLCYAAAAICVFLPQLGIVPDDLGPLQAHQAIMALGFGMGIVAFLMFRGRSD